MSHVVPPIIYWKSDSFQLSYNIIVRFSRDFPRILSKKPFKKETGKKPQRSIVQSDHSFILKRNMRIIPGTDVKLLKKRSA